MNAYLLHYGGIALTIGLSGLGTGLAQGYAARVVLDAMDRQEIGIDAIRRALMIGLVFIESGGILALVIAFLLMSHEYTFLSQSMGLVHLNIGFCMGLVTGMMAIASSFALAAATEAIARQPLIAHKIISFMMISQTFIEAPVIFAFVLLLLINSNLDESIAWAEAVKLSIAAFGIAMGTIGPAIAQSRFSWASGEAMGLSHSAYPQIFSFSLLTQAIIETPVIFVLISTLFIIFKILPFMSPLTAATSLFPAALVVALGASSAAVGVSYVASKTCRLISLNTEHYGRLFRASFVAQAFIESCGIYALVIGLLMILRA